MLVVAVSAWALRLVVGHARGMARPAAPFQLTPDQRAELRARLRQATMAPRLRLRLQCVQLRDRGWPVPRSPGSWRSARRPCGGRLGGWWPVGWTGWRIGPGLAGRPGSLTRTWTRSRSCWVRPPSGGRGGRRGSWPRGWPTAVGCRSAQAGWGCCCGRGAAAGRRPPLPRGRPHGVLPDDQWVRPAGRAAVGSWPGRSAPPRSPAGTRSPCSTDRSGPATQTAQARIRRSRLSPERCGTTG
jgi:hypothetical protein